jgi:NAD(P)-dependent dehydrogenase (short-subunit alcohol dehydrogenase family)
MDWKEKVCILTGSTSGIGQHTAISLARKGIQMVLPVRNLNKGHYLKNLIIRKTGNHQVHIFECDLSSMASIRKFCKDFKEQFSSLNILINNAGLMETKRVDSDDGIELTFAVNHLAQFLMTNLLLPVMQRSKDVRIINVASLAHRFGSINLNDIEGKHSWSSCGSYSRSKLANVLFTRHLARLLEGSHITVNSLHPGIVDTMLYQKMPQWLYSIVKPFFTSSKKGARTTLYLALWEEVEGITGEYFYKNKIWTPSAQARNDDIARELWRISCEYTNLPDNTYEYGKTG